MAESFTITGPGLYLMRDGGTARIDRELSENDRRRINHGYRWAGSRVNVEDNADWIHSGAYCASSARDGIQEDSDIVSKIAAHLPIVEMERAAREEIACNETSGMSLADQACRAFALGAQIGEAMKAAQKNNDPAQEISLELGKTYLTQNGTRRKVIYEINTAKLFLAIQDSWGNKAGHLPMLYTKDGQLFIDESAYPTGKDLNATRGRQRLVSEVIEEKEEDPMHVDLDSVAQEIIKAQQGTRNLAEV